MRFWLSASLSAYLPTCLTFVLPTCLYGVMFISMLAYLLTCLPTCLPTYLLVSPSACLPFAYLPTYVRTYPPSCLPVHLFFQSIYLPARLRAQLLVCLSVDLPA